MWFALALTSRGDTHRIGLVHAGIGLAEIDRVDGREGDLSRLSGNELGATELDKCTFGGCKGCWDGKHGLTHGTQGSPQQHTVRRWRGIEQYING